MPSADASLKTFGRLLTSSLPGRRARGDRMISGRTTLIAHIGYPTETFKAPLIYNPYFEKAGIDAVVVPMGVKAEDYRDFLKSISHSRLPLGWHDQRTALGFA